MKNIFYLFKVHHFIKNFIIFIPILASHKIYDVNYIHLLLHLINISFLSAIIYFINNVNDYKADLKNKKLNYKLNLKNNNLYYFASISFFLLQIIILIYINQNIWKVCFLYFCLAVSYNFFFKKIIYIDILIITIFHLLRLFYGSSAFQIDLSAILTSFCAFLFLMIATNKRYNEIEKNFINRPYTINHSNFLKFLQILLALGSVFILSYYIFNSDNIYLYKNFYLLIVKIFLFSFIIINFLIYQFKYKEDAVLFFYKSKVNTFLFIIFVILYFINSNFF